MEKCAMLVVKLSKRHQTDGTEVPNQDKIWKLAQNETCKYLGILEADTINQVQMKSKIQKEYLKWTRKVLETKLSGRSLTKGINTWVYPSLDIRNPFWSETETNLKNEQKNKKIMTMHKALYPRDDVDRLYV